MSEEIKGWRLVPIKPTETMLCSFDLSLRDYEQWAALLAAAPEPSASASQQELLATTSVGMEPDVSMAVAWINKAGDYVEVSTPSTVYGSHTIPLYPANSVTGLMKASYYDGYTDREEEVRTQLATLQASIRDLTIKHDIACSTIALLQDKCDVRGRALALQCNETKALQAKLERAEITAEMLSDALEDSLALNINMVDASELETLSYFSEYKRTIKNAEEAIAKYEVKKS